MNGASSCCQVLQVLCSFADMVCFQAQDEPQPPAAPGLSARPSLSDKPGLEDGSLTEAEQDAHYRKMIEIEG